MKILFLLSFVLFFGFVAKTQDTIFHMSGKIEVGKVIEISPDYVKYKKLSNIEGPVFSVHKTSVNKIVYENGAIDIINEKQKVETNVKVEYEKIDKNAASSKNVVYSKIEINPNVTDNEIYNYLKIDPLLVLCGEVPVSYERRIGNKTSFEISLGITLVDYFSIIYNDYYNDNAINRVGYTYSIGVRLYPSNYTIGMEEIYLNPEIKIKKYVVDYEQMSGINIDPPFTENTIKTDIQLKIGYVDSWSGIVMADYYCGIGLRNKVVKSAEMVSNGSNYVLQQTISDDLYPCLTVGIKICFGW